MCLHVSVCNVQEKGRDVADVLSVCGGESGWRHLGCGHLQRNAGEPILLLLLECGGGQREGEPLEGSGARRCQGQGCLAARAWGCKGEPVPGSW